MATKLVIRFHADRILDVTEIHRHVLDFYNVGYSGLYSHNGYLAVFVQSSERRYRMAPKKMKKICSRFGQIEDVQIYDKREGDLIDEVGQFREPGRRPVREVINEINITGDHNTVHNNVDNSVTNNIDNRTIHLHIHALGKEDITHITVEQFKKLIGDKEKNIQTAKDDLTAKLTDVEYEARIFRQWNQSRYDQRRKFNKRKSRDEAIEINEVRKGVKGCKLIPVPELDTSDEEEEDHLGGEPVIYDPDSDSEHTMETKKRYENVALLNESGHCRAYTLPHELAALMYENPNNSNIIASAKSNNIKYLRGSSWRTIFVGDLDKIVDNWILKTRQTVDLLKKRAGEDFTQSFEGEYVSKVMSMFDEERVVTCAEWKAYGRHVKTRSVQCIENMNLELKGVELETGKRVKRLSGYEHGLQEGDIVRNVGTWDDLRRLGGRA